MTKLSRAILVLGMALVGLLVAATAQAGPIGFAVRSNVDNHLYSIDMATGATADLGLVNFGDAEGLSFVGSSLFAIGGTVDEFWDITLPPGSLVGGTGARSGIDAGLSYDGTSGTMYNIQGDASGSGLYTIDITTGLATLVGSDIAFADGLGINSAGQAFAANAIDDILYSVDLTTGLLTAIGGFGVDLFDQTGLSFDETGALWMLTSRGEIYTLDTGTGAATFVANTLDGMEGLAINPIPEPGAATLFGISVLVGSIFCRRRA